jgi:transmembrane sensor
MDYRDESLEKIGARIQDLLGEDPGAHEEMRRGRIALLDEVERRNAASSLRRSSRARRRRPWLALTLAASCAAGAAGVWLWTRPVTFDVGEARVGQLGDIVQGADGKATPLHFSDGSTVLLHEGGRLRVLSLKAGAARVLVEDGAIDASIAHRRLGKTKWDFEAGPYRVTVAGTRFHMAFKANDGSFSLSTQEGQVVVSGGCQEAPRTVSAGEGLQLSCAPHVTLPRPSVDSAPAMEIAPASPERELAPSGRSTNKDRWRELLAAGRLAQGLSAAERVGFERVCQAATAKELLALGDAGRFFGSPMRAVTALRVLRQRFPGSMEAGTAAFTLGRIAFEKQHAYSDAAGWFETYLREQPSGPLMGDAFGRLMEARLQSGDHEGAHANAQQYLRRFPEGPYASEARRLLSK